MKYNNLQSRIWSESRDEVQNKIIKSNPNPVKQKSENPIRTHKKLKYG